MKLGKSRLTLAQSRARVIAFVVVLILLPPAILKLGLLHYIVDYVPPELVGWLILAFVLLWPQYKALFALKIVQIKHAESKGAYFDGKIEPNYFNWFPVYADISLNRFCFEKEDPWLKRLIGWLSVGSIIGILFTFLYFNVLAAFIVNPAIVQFMQYLQLISFILYPVTKAIIVFLLLREISNSVRALWGIVWLTGYIAIVISAKFYLNELNNVQVERSYGEA